MKPSDAFSLAALVGGAALLGFALGPRPGVSRPHRGDPAVVLREVVLREESARLAAGKALEQAHAQARAEPEIVAPPPPPREAVEARPAVPAMPAGERDDAATRTLVVEVLSPVRAPLFAYVDVWDAPPAHLLDPLADDELDELDGASVEWDVDFGPQPSPEAMRAAGAFDPRWLPGWLGGRDARAPAAAKGGSLGWLAGTVTFDELPRRSPLWVSVARWCDVGPDGELFEPVHVVSVGPDEQRVSVSAPPLAWIGGWIVRDGRALREGWSVRCLDVPGIDGAAEADRWSRFALVPAPRGLQSIEVLHAEPGRAARLVVDVDVPAAGELALGPLDLPRVPLVAGRVRDALDACVDAEVQLLARGALLASVEADADGSFSFDGAFDAADTLRVQPYDWRRGHVVELPLDALPALGLDVLVSRPAPGVEVELHTHAPDGSYAPGFVVALVTPGARAGDAPSWTAGDNYSSGCVRAVRSVFGVERAPQTVVAWLPGTPLTGAGLAGAGLAGAGLAGTGLASAGLASTGLAGERTFTPEPAPPSDGGEAGACEVVVEVTPAQGVLAGTLRIDVERWRLPSSRIDVRVLPEAIADAYLRSGTYVKSRWNLAPGPFELPGLPCGLELRVDLIAPGERVIATHRVTLRPGEPLDLGLIEAR